MGEVITKLCNSSELRARHLRSNVAFDRAREPNYLARSFTAIQRVQAYYGHYGYLVEALTAPALDGLISSEVPLYVHDAHRIIITGTHDRHEEGELQLQLWNAERLLYVLGVTIVSGETLGLQDRRALLVSRLQGVLGVYFDIRNATKAFGDIQPKAVLLAALEGVAVALDVNAIVSVAASNQIAVASSQPEALVKGYDEFFLQVGAERLSDCFFLLRPDRPRLVSTAADRAHVKRAERKRKLKREIQAVAAAQVRSWLRGPARQP